MTVKRDMRLPSRISTLPLYDSTSLTVPQNYNSRFPSPRDLCQKTAPHQAQERPVQTPLTPALFLVKRGRWIVIKALEVEGVVRWALIRDKNLFP